jgi:hypothetical protein
MKNAAKQITDMKEAIESGEVPGAFSDDRTTFTFPVLEYAGSKGATLQWTISVTLLGKNGHPTKITDAMLASPVKDLPESYKAEIITIAGQKGGAVRDVKPTYVSAGKPLNKTNALTQAICDAIGQYTKKKRTAQATQEGEPVQEETTSVRILRPLPMLVKKEGETRDATLTAADFKEGAVIQRKLNGVRAVMGIADGLTSSPRKLVFCYSRTGIDYPCQKAILDDVRGLYATAPAIRPGEYGVSPTASQRTLEAYAKPYFDGELYKFGESLNAISGQARRETAKGAKKAVALHYYIFDVFFPYAKALDDDMASVHRQAYLDAVFKAAEQAGQQHAHLVRVENAPVHSLAEVKAKTKEYLKEGYEGSIVRKAKAGYRYSEHNYHSSGLLKFKPIFDSEFTVVGYTQGMKGKDVGAIVWVCEVPDPPNPRDKTFNVVPKDMTYEMRYALFTLMDAKVPDPNDPAKTITRFARDVKGLPLTLEYGELAPDTGKPLRAKALTFRTYEAGPEKDPMAPIYAEAEQLTSQVSKAPAKGTTTQTARKPVGGRAPAKALTSASAFTKAATKKPAPLSVAEQPSEPVDTSGLDAYIEELTVVQAPIEGIDEYIEDLLGEDQPD